MRVSHVLRRSLQEEPCPVASAAMASHLPHLARSTGRQETTPTFSKIPTSSISWFSRSKHGRAKSRDRSENRVGATSTRTRIAVSANPQDPRGHGLGIAASPPSSHASSTQEPRQRNVLRRKTTSTDQRGRYARTESSSASSYAPPVPGRRYETASTPGDFSTSASESQQILGLALPTASMSTSLLPSTTAMNPDQATSSSRMAVYQNRKAPYTLSTQNLPPPTPSFAQSSGSSTRRSESPGSLSCTSTPTSMSSYSPSISLPTKSPLNMRQSSPTRSRPPVTRWRIKQENVDAEVRGLAAVRESITSSSSSSTVKGTERGENINPRQITYRLSPPPPSPPLRGNKSKNTTSCIQTVTQNLPNKQALNRRQATYGPIAQEKEFHRSTSPNSTSRQVSSPPPRPSREGTPKLDDYIVPSPVIHSNLSRLATTGHKRRESAERTESRKEAPVVSKTGLVRSPSSASAISARPSRLPSPSPGGTSSSVIRPSQSRFAEPVQSRNLTSGYPNNVLERSSKEAHPLSASSSRSSSRFGLFSRRTRSPMETSGHESTDRSAKKGPVAGTGHEGYGKYAKRGRSGSMSTSASRGRSTSTSGTASSTMARTPLSRKSSTTSRGEPEMDDFLLERLAPVVISGGGMLDNRHSGLEMYRTSSGESSSDIIANDIRYAGRPPVSIPAMYQTTASSAETGDARPLRRESRIIPHAYGHSSENSETTDRSSRSTSVSRPTLAARRSMHRSQLFKEAGPMKLPTPINTRVLAPSPLDSRDTVPTSAMTTESTALLSDDVSEGREGNWLKPRKAAKRARSPKKWNFFQRALASPKKTMGHERRHDMEDTSRLPVTVSALPNSRPLPYYAILDMNEQEDFGNTTNIDRTMQNDIGIRQGSPEIPQYEHSPVVQKYDNSMLLPSPPTFPAEFAHENERPAQTRVELRQEALPIIVPAASEPSKPRVPRLQQVGRIPRVISKRDRHHNPPPQSFSRPFARPSPHDNQPVLSDPEESGAREPGPPVLAVNTETIPFDPWGNELSAKPASAPAVAQQDSEPTNQDEFLMFPPRKFSEISASTSSGGGSFAAAIATTAIVPEPNTAPGEDEVWNEYNDFLDTVESPAPLPEHSVHQTEHVRNARRMTPPPLYIRKDFQSENATTPAVSTRELATAHGLPDPPQMSKLLAPRQSAEMASSPMSFTDFFAGYADRNRVSATSKHQSSSSGSRSSTASVPGKEGGIYGKRYTQIMATKTEGSASTQSNLRFSALMTSRWLSFGRVLFSPAHYEIQSNRQDRVLVLDGLGNDDW